MSIKLKVNSWHPQRPSLASAMAQGSHPGVSPFGIIAVIGPNFARTRLVGSSSAFSPGVLTDPCQLRPAVRQPLPGSLLPYLFSSQCFLTSHEPDAGCG